MSVTQLLGEAVGWHLHAFVERTKRSSGVRAMMRQERARRRWRKLAPQRLVP